MPRGKKKFIDKKNAVTFRLVHRSQQDPLVADENAPQRVLQPIESKSKTKEDKDKRLEEQHKYGIYFDDDYNYLQHLRDTKPTMEWEEIIRIPAKNESSANKRDNSYLDNISLESKPSSSKDSVIKKEVKLMLPSSVFPSEVEENVGLLNKAAPHKGLRLDLDPDVIAALDDDFDFEDPENQLEDNFIELANAECSDIDEDEEINSEFDGESSDGNLNGEIECEDDEYFCYNKANTARSEGQKSRFTEYSHTSYTANRNENLKFLDAKFEKFYEEYDEEKIGSLDCEEIEGHIDETGDMLLNFAKEFEEEHKRHKIEKDPELKEIVLNRLSESLDENNEEFDYIEVKQKPQFDCESILSTYSNIYNRPKIIDESNRFGKIKINNRTGMPVDELNSNKLTAKALAKLDKQNDNMNCDDLQFEDDKSLLSHISSLSIRPKNETPVERKIRKKNLKEFRRERRIEKKATSKAFMEDTKKQVKIALNRANIQGKRLV